jgi:hypothetical protein
MIWLLLTLVAQEVYVPTTPMNPPGSAVTHLRVLQLLLRHGQPIPPVVNPLDVPPPTPGPVGPEQALVDVTFAESSADGTTLNGARTFKCVYTGAAAEELARTLNIANLTTTSLEKTLMEKCAADGQISAGSITGTPMPPGNATAAKPAAVPKPTLTKPPLKKPK